MKKNMRLLAALAAALVLGFAACHHGTDSDDPQGEPSKADEPTYAVNIAQSENGAVTADKTSAKAGETVTLTVTPSEDYKLATLSVTDSGGGAVAMRELVAGAKYAFTMPLGAVSVAATFAPITYAVTIQTDTDGMAVTDRTDGLFEGEVVTLTLTPNNGYEFGHLFVESADGRTIEATASDGNGTFTFAMPKSNVSVRAEFKKINYYLVIYEDGLDDAHVSMPSDPAEYQAGETVLIIFSKGVIGLREGYDFAGWKDKKSGTLYTSGGTTEFTMSGENVTLVAQWTVQVPPTFSVTLLGDGDDGTAFFNGSLTASKTSGILAGEAVTLTATPSEGYELGQIFISDENFTDIEVTQGSDANTYSFVMPKADVSVAAIFKEPDKYTVTYSDGLASEYVSIPRDTMHYAAGESVTVLFTDIGIRAGYDFAGWSDKNGTRYTNGGTTAFTMPSENVTLVAQWTEATANIKLAPDAVGDIVLRDGTAVAKEEVYRMNSSQKAMAVAVIFYAGSDGDLLGDNILGVGLTDSRGDTETETGVFWATSAAEGYDKEITATICTPSVTGYEAARTATFASDADTDGSGNYAALKAAVSDWETEGRYPAWEWAGSYGKKHGFEGSPYAYGWYLPTSAEMTALWRARETVQPLLEAAGGRKVATDDYSWYYTSSQSAKTRRLAWGFYFVTGRLDEILKEYQGVSACAVRSFSNFGMKGHSEPKYVGDIVFSDGSATPYDAYDLTLTEEQKNAAVAVIFYRGTGLNSDDASGNADTTTVRTLGVGLTFGADASWCTAQANAYAVSIDSIRCDRNASGGFSGKKNGSDNLEQIGAYLTANGIADDTADESKYPAFYWTKNYASHSQPLLRDTVYESGWYLPSLAEQHILFSRDTLVKKVLKLCSREAATRKDGTGLRIDGGIGLPYGGLASSATDSADSAYLCLNEISYFYFPLEKCKKDTDTSFCAIREF